MLRPSHDVLAPRDRLRPPLVERRGLATCEQFGAGVFDRHGQKSQDTGPKARGIARRDAVQRLQVVIWRFTCQPCVRKGFVGDQKEKPRSVSYGILG